MYKKIYNPRTTNKALRRAPRPGILRAQAQRARAPSCMQGSQAPDAHAPGVSGMAQPSPPLPICAGGPRTGAIRRWRPAGGRAGWHCR